VVPHIKDAPNASS
jgi:hypothetical protein